VKKGREGREAIEDREGGKRVFQVGGLVRFVPALLLPPSTVSEGK